MLRNLLRTEGAARSASSELELSILAVNEPLQIVRAKQAFLLSCPTATGAFEVRAISGMAAVDRNIPFVCWLERLVAGLARSEGLNRTAEFVLPAYCDPTDEVTETYPFHNMIWVPLWRRGGKPTEGLLLARETPWIEGERRLAERLAEAFGHAFAQLRGTVRPLRQKFVSARNVALAAIVMTAIGLIPMHISAIAPAEIVAREPVVVSMPVDGLVDDVLVEPNESVAAGQILVRLSDTEARNKLLVSEREVVVARARVEQSNSMAFTDAKGHHELGIARAELELKIAERNYARELLDRQTIRAARSGIAVFSDRKDLRGKPFKTGDRLMQIAQPSAIEIRIDLPVADSIALQKGAPFRVFLDSNPLDAISGTVAHVDYTARPTAANVAAYRIVGRFDGHLDETPRLGTRGTAQVYGPRGTVALHLFRRPLNALRQWAGL